MRKGDASLGSSSLNWEWRNYTGKVIKAYQSMKLHLGGIIFPSAWGRFKAVTKTLKDFLGVWNQQILVYFSVSCVISLHTHTPLQCPVNLIFPIKPTCMRIALHAIRAHQLSLSLFPLLLPRKWNAHFIGQIIDSFMEKFISGWSHWKLRGYLLVLKNSFKTFKVQCQNRV